MDIWGQATRNISESLHLLLFSVVHCVTRIIGDSISQGRGDHKSAKGHWLCLKATWQLYN